MFNPDKLVLGQKKLKIFGFNIDKVGIHPTEEMKNAIKGFEIPKTIKMMRAFMETQDLMGKVRHKLNKTTSKQMKNLIWTPEEKESFRKLKLAAVEAMEVGIERMLREEVTKETSPMVLTSDWSQKGTGFQLHNVSCECHRKNEGNFRHQCCEDRWRLVSVSYTHLTLPTICSV